jgi:Uma2 family endonuclease
MVALPVHEAKPVVPLESGDRLTREEFHRRYLCRPDIKKAELIEGVVYVASPVKFAGHGEEHLFMGHWLSHYRLDTPGVRAGDNSTVILEGDNEPQPDLFLFRTGGQAAVDEEGYITGAPDLAIEIAASSASYDLHDKKRVYARNGVQEYIVWQIYEKRIGWWRLREGAYVPLAPDDRGVIRSEVFPGLRLNVAAMLAGDMAAVLAELEPRHA